MRKIVAAALCLLLGACSFAQLNDRLSTPQQRALALRTIAAMRAGDGATLSQIMAPPLFAQTRPQLPAIKAFMDTPGTPALVTVNQNRIIGQLRGRTVTCLNYEYGGGAHWFIAQVCIQDDGRRMLVDGVTAVPARQRPSTMNDFSFTKAGLQDYLWVLAMIAAVATSITGCVVAIRSKGVKQRWLWAIGSLVGLGQFSLIWGTGGWTIHPIYFSLLGAAFLRASPFDPWVLSFSLPVVAIVFLILRKRLLPKTEHEDEEIVE